ncbi:ABC transporter ATP-binding protein [Nocardia sp. XZ_19_385]|uniref:ABC transporter ATP-binding protein n=1 Tax=Nocardia sp. XZ_19_385 TaxID=2769488 RepID=UPI00188E59B2|nr:ABC transporter ATP-binding protein [Nocardia sp. XZ_19_385]
MATTLTAHIRCRVLDAVLDIDLDAAPVTVLFGPSGAGKTTLLRCLAGLDRPEPGSRISLGEQVWDGPGVHVPTMERRVGYLFQDHALFPHLSVTGNVGYGLHHLPRRDRTERIREALTTAGAEHLHDRHARGLSGGEAARVALARALAPHPQLLLLDEPLAALDAPTRARLRTDLRHRLRAAGVPTLLVSHDRADALALGDRIAVLVDGRIRQLDTVETVFSRPADHQVAAAVDTETVIPATVISVGDGLVRLRAGTTELLATSIEALPEGAHVLVCIRAENVSVSTTGPDTHRHDSPRNQLPAALTALTDHGPLLRADLDAGFPLAAYITRPTRDELALRVGDTLTAIVKAPAIHLVPRD